MENPTFLLSPFSNLILFWVFCRGATDSHPSPALGFIAWKTQKKIQKTEAEYHQKIRFFFSKEKTSFF